MYSRRIIKELKFFIIKEIIMKRASGILLPVFSLPSPYGIGTIYSGKKFIDFLSNAAQRYWQILPLGPVGACNSPYQTFSAFAGNPLFIDPGELMLKGLLSEEEEGSARVKSFNAQVDYALVEETFAKLFRLAFSRADKDEINKYMKKDSEIYEYSLFMAIKESLSGAPLCDWPEDIRLRKPSALLWYSQKLRDEMLYHAFLQMEFFSQWADLKQYANEKDIQIIGDIPIYVAFDSADAWANPELFQFDENSTRLAVAGCPPDAFAANGQLWGNPLYRWDYHAQTGYVWWISRLRHCFTLYDVVRVDHFRGFDEYYAIPYGDKTAENGVWKKGPGIDLFHTVKKELGDANIIAEDLGYLTESVMKLVEDTGYPGMKVLQFAFDSREESNYLPHNYPHNCVVYTGTHDNNTVRGWLDDMCEEDNALAEDYMNNADTPKDERPWEFIRLALGSVADLAVIPLQDYLCLGTEARINLPSTLGNNWKWRLVPGQVTDEMLAKMCHLNKLFGRL